VPQLVFEFWSQELESAISPIRQSLHGTRTSDFVMLSDTSEYRPTEEGLDAIVAKMVFGAVVSLSLRPENAPIRYALANGSFFGGENRDGWFGTIEYLDSDYESLWTLILSVPGLQLACIGLDEGPEFTDGMMSLGTFPWDDPALVIGAIRTPCGWAVRKGRKYFKPTLGQIL
jgi:hypothetical protein